MKVKTFKPGDVVIVPTNQSGCIWYITDKEVAVLLRNKDIWYGQSRELRFPINDEELENCIINLSNRW
jgi:hypothetical protein